MIGLRGKGGEVEEGKIKLTENSLILDQFYSLLLYSSFLSFNPNRP